jgi:hypothetical protein
MAAMVLKVPAVVTAVTVASPVTLALASPGRHGGLQGKAVVVPPVFA